MTSYEIGFVKDGNRLIVEVARRVDQLSCETWQYYGERDTTVANLKRRKAELLSAVNAEYKTTFDRITVRKIADADFSAGH